MVEISMNPP